jgi:hypothetical protein
MIQIYPKQQEIRKETPLYRSYLLMALVAGIFLAGFDILVHAHFLERMGYKYLATSYILGGITGITLTYLYASFFRRVYVLKLNAIINTLILLSTTFYLVGSLLFPSKELAYYGMVILFPVNILMVLSLWRYGRKMLFPQQSKTISSKLNFYFWCGTALGGMFTTMGLFQFYSFDFLTIGGITFILVFWVLQFVFIRMHGNKSCFRSGRENLVPVRNNLFLFFTSKFARRVFLFALLSSVVFFSIHFAFINIAAAGFQNVIGFSKFYGLFIAVLMVFIFGIDRFLIKKILYSYDSPYSLVLIPAAILAILLISIGGYYFFSSYQPHEHFTLMFLLMAVSKVGIESTRTIIKTPSLRALFQTLDIRYRQVAYPRIEGTAFMFGLLVSGVVLLGLTFLKIFSFNLIIYWTAFVSSLWLVWAVLLVKQYSKEQLKALDRLRYKKTGMSNSLMLEETLWKILTGNDIIKAKHLLETLAAIQPLIYEDYLERLLAHPNIRVRNFVIKKILIERIHRLLPELEKKANEASGETHENLILVLEDYKKNTSHNKSTEELKDIIYSGETKDRIWLASSINKIKTEEKAHILFDLVKDIEPVVQDAALKSLARQKKVRFNYALLDFIYPEKFNPYALEVITRSGKEAIDYLEREQLVHGTTDIVKARIIRLYSRIGTQESIEKIITDLGNHDRYLLQHSLQALQDINYQVNSKNKYKLLNLIIKQIGILAHTLHFYKSIKGLKKYVLLAEAYRLEIDINYDLLFRLMSLVYNPHIIASLRQMFFEGSHSQVNHAMELADLYIDQDLKPVFFPLVEDISLSERLKKLDYYFIQPKVKASNIIRATLTHDFKTLSLYPRACAIMHVLKNGLTAYKDELVFNIYHADSLLSETAIYTLLKLHPEAIAELQTDERFDKNLEKLIQQTKEIKDEDLFFYRFTELKKFKAFNNLSERVQLSLAHGSRKIKLSNNENLNIENLRSFERLLLSDQLVFQGVNNYVISCYENFIDISLLADYGISDIATENEFEAWLFPSHIVNELLIDHVDLSNLYFRIIEYEKVSAVR